MAQAIQMNESLLHLNMNFPDRITIGYNTFKVKPYLPQPMRCTKCQGFYHKARDCTSKVRCVRCAGEHEFAKCTVNDQAKFKCKNCRGAHSAAYRECSKYKEVAKVLKVSVTKNISIGDAIKEVEMATRGRSK